MTDCCYIGTAICEHSQIKESCWYCKVNGQLQALTDMYKSISIQCAANHEHKIRQIDENRKISRRIDELEKIPLNSYESTELRCVLKRLDEVQRFQDITHLEYQNRNKKPHKCPVCNGSVKIIIDPATPMSGIQAMFGKRDENGMYYHDCKSCEGKGIVWN